MLLLSTALQLKLALFCQQKKILKRIYVENNNKIKFVKNRVSFFLFSDFTLYNYNYSEYRNKICVI